MSALISSNQHGSWMKYCSICLEYCSWLLSFLNNRLGSSQEEDSVSKVNSWLRYWVVMAAVSLPGAYSCVDCAFILWCLLLIIQTLSWINGEWFLTTVSLRQYSFAGAFYLDHLVALTSYSFRWVSICFCNSYLLHDYIHIIQGESKQSVISKNMAITTLKSIQKGKNWCVLENST